jgi:signal transduction histidine kinase
MKRTLNISIKQRIYWSFSLLAFVFVANASITLIVLNNNKKEHKHISTITDPSIEALHDFRKVIRESMMFTTNWVFIRTDDVDKNALKYLQATVYPALKKHLTSLSANWYQKSTADSLQNVFIRFDQVIQDEKSIMNLLQKFDDYNDASKKFDAEEQLESIVIPKITILSVSLNNIMDYEEKYKIKEEDKLEAASAFLRTLIFILALSTVCLGIFFSLYMAKKIIVPIKQIRSITNDLGKGIIRKINFSASGDEISKMILSVNNLSERLQANATFAHETGLRNFDMPFTPLSDEDTLGKALLAMRENLKTGETNLAIKNKELERKNKELEEFAFVASHDLQEPLRTTSSYVELLQQQYKGNLDKKADKYLSYISQASDRMQLLVSDLLEYSRIGNKKELKQIDCNKVLSETLADLNVAINETSAEITVGHLPVICGYPTEINQLFQNLISNSIKFRKKDIPPSITICGWDYKDHWQFAFSDNGIGIAKHHFERIFTIFQRLHTRNQYHGSGIGLAHCKKIVGLHKGKIWLESTPGEGTTFYFTIPQNIN